MAATKTLNEDQKAALKSIKKFIDHPAADTFVLKGCAGTGKTFLMQHLAKWLNEKKRPFKMLASTGRAASVLKGRTGFSTSTVHSELYRFARVVGDEEEITEDAPPEKYGQMTFQFALRPPDKEKMLYIVDESSMLSSESNGDKTTSFGSGKLLSDFFEASRSGKIIFVGDPCQLPPVGQSFSPALDMNWLSAQRRIAINVALNKIERTAEGNEILILADSIRNMTSQKEFAQYPRLPAKNLDQVCLESCDKELFKKYVEKYKASGPDSAIAIARSNKTVKDINRAFRRELYGALDLPVKKGDVLLVTHNNYKVPLTNGDFVRVTFVGNEITQAGFGFLEVRVQSVNCGEFHEVLLSLDVLNGPDNNFNQEDQRLLMIDFSRRMKKQDIRPNSDPYKKAMMNDSYVNCLRAKFGYAATCHKSQGGEWDHVFLFLDKSMYSMKKPELFRWWYTAVTRAKRELNMVEGWWVS